MKKRKIMLIGGFLVLVFLITSLALAAPPDHAGQPGPPDHAGQPGPPDHAQVPEHAQPGKATPAEEAYDMLYDLCDIAGYGINSGINVGEKADEAAAYILDKLHKAGLTNAKLEPIQVNSPLPEYYEVIVEAKGSKTILSESCFPIHWTVGTPAEGITGELVYVGYGLDSDFERVDVANKIVLIDEKFMRGYMKNVGQAATKKAIEREFNLGIYENKNF